jgi:hypothetical protein
MNNHVLGSVSFGPAWESEPTLRDLYDQACRSIVRAECKIEELEADLALKDQCIGILAKERDGALELIRAFRREEIAESCQHKADADGNWANL